ncbi:unnamed protein product, partial [marine sediment metagenome]
MDIKSFKDHLSPVAISNIPIINLVLKNVQAEANRFIKVVIDPDSIKLVALN